MTLWQSVFLQALLMHASLAVNTDSQLLHCKPNSNKVRSPQMMMLHDQV